MSYQVLARKWRPAKFEQMVGQSHVLMALTNALSQQRLHHAYLFTGTRGVGKTSLARLFAKGLNCETGITANPCGKCSSCIEIAQGRFVDLIEVDAASRTKVDDTRELLDNVQYRPSRGRFKVYLIDEVHMLSRSSFNALLKTLEEPPEHVKFLLATTDPHKLPVTVLSRCLQFNLKSLSQDEISKQLEYVITQEQLPFEQQALSLLAKAANGSMRDALSLTDQAIAFGSGQVMLTQVQTMLGSIDEQHVLALLKALCDAEVGPLMQTVAKVLAFGADAEEVLRSLLELLHQITLTQFAPATAQQSLFSEQILAFAQQLAPEQVQLYYQMLLNGRKDLPFAPDPKSGLEMALLRAVAFTPEKQVKRWVTTTPANIDLSVIDHSSPPGQEVNETGPKSALQSKVDTLPSSSSTAPVKIVSTVDLEKQDSDIVDDESVIASLVAEQTLVMSQAQSLGFNSSSPQSDVVQAEPATAVEANHVIEQAEHQETSDAKDVDAKTEANLDVTASANLSTEHGNQPTSDQNSEQQSAVSTANTNDAEKSDNVDDSLSAYAFMDYDTSGDASMEYEPLDHDEYMAFSALNEATEANNIGNVTDAVQKPQRISDDIDNINDDSRDIVNKQNSDIIDHGTNQELTRSEDTADDFLDEVLASRDLLIADVGALHLKEELAKKEPAKVITPRKVKPVSTPVTAANESSVGSVEAKPSSVTEEQAIVDYDRPPWVKPKEDEQVNTFADINEDIKPAVEATIQQPSTNSHPIDNQHQKPASTLTTSSLAANPLNMSAEPATTQSHEVTAFEPHSIQGDEVDLHWYKVMTNVSVGGRVRQLGVNSVCSALSNPMVLVLKPNQKHLSAQTAIEQLQQALSEYLEQPTEVQIQIGVVPERETPLELRKRFHRELIAQAQQAILIDDNVKWMVQRLSAQLDSDSIEYPAEQLGQIAQEIALINAS
ncbi:DNA polymerase III subunit gamma/tau [Shewanella polaris]|uniref:DNA-directed DNA polymerase n=1 Tax=Shewanella polaris TaxID=2588449 RepID=A0A4Y5YE12_9GAMM|nr:DNA polymerase III subunit gamma/tau [Shewanella polaris]QDE30877.1 DNA polymerase III subunit gamma/tau [Shewanella polaris]